MIHGTGKIDRSSYYISFFVICLQLSRSFCYLIAITYTNKMPPTYSRLVTVCLDLNEAIAIWAHLLLFGQTKCGEKTKKKKPKKRSPVSYTKSLHSTKRLSKIQICRNKLRNFGSVTNKQNVDMNRNEQWTTIYNSNKNHGDEIKRMWESEKTAHGIRFLFPSIYCLRFFRRCRRCFSRSNQFKVFTTLERYCALPGGDDHIDSKLWENYFRFTTFYGHVWSERVCVWVRTQSA